MSVGAVLGAIVAATAGLALLRRRRRATRARTAQVVRAARALRGSLELRHPHVHWRGFVAGSATAVVEVDGQETAVPLHQLIREIAAFPDGIDHLVDRLVAELHAEALEQIGFHSFADIAHALLPQVRTMAWVAERGGRFGDAALLTRPIGADLEVCYVIDDERAMTFLCRRHLLAFGRTAEEIHGIAVANLQRRTGSGLRMPRSGVVCKVAIGDGYDAARLLLLDPFGVDGQCFAVPERDLLWVGTPSDVELCDLLARTAAQCASSDRPISSRVYRLRAGRVEAVGA